MAGRVALLGQPRLVVAAADDPVAGPLPRHLGSDQGDEVGDGAVRRRAKAEIRLCEPDAHRVGVRVVQPWGRRPAPQVDRLDPGPESCPGLRVRTDRDDLASADGDRGDLGPVPVHRLDAAVDEEQIAGHGPHLIGTGREGTAGEADERRIRPYRAPSAVISPTAVTRSSTSSSVFHQPLATRATSGFGG